MTEKPVAKRLPGTIERGVHGIPAELGHGGPGPRLVEPGVRLSGENGREHPAGVAGTEERDEPHVRITVAGDSRLSLREEARLAGDFVDPALRELTPKRLA